MEKSIIAYRLKKIRKTKGLAQEEVARKAGIDLGDYQAMELGQWVNTALDKERLEKVSKALDIEMEELFPPKEGSIVIYGDQKESNNYCIINSRDDQDIAKFNAIADSLKSLTSQLQMLTDSFSILAKNVDYDAKAKEVENDKDLKHFFKDGEKGEGDKEE